MQSLSGQVNFIVNCLLKSVDSWENGVNPFLSDGCLLSSKATYGWLKSHFSPALLMWKACYPLGKLVAMDVVLKWLHMLHFSSLSELFGGNYGTRKRGRKKKCITVSVWRCVAVRVSSFVLVFLRCSYLQASCTNIPTSSFCCGGAHIIRRFTNTSCNKGFYKVVVCLKPR